MKPIQKFTPTTTVAALIACIFFPTIARAANIDVTVGGPGILKYSPQFVVRISIYAIFLCPIILFYHQNANPGDVVRFIFQQKNHTATQSTFENPCARAQDGFDSGLFVISRSSTLYNVAYSK